MVDVVFITGIYEAGIEELISITETVWLDVVDVVFTADVLDVVFITDVLEVLGVLTTVGVLDVVFVTAA